MEKEVVAAGVMREEEVGTMVFHGKASKVVHICP